MFIQNAAKSQRQPCDDDQYEDFVKQLSPEQLLQWQQQQNLRYMQQRNLQFIQQQQLQLQQQQRAQVIAGGWHTEGGIIDPRVDLT